MEREVHIPAAYGETAVEIRTPLMNDLVQRLAGALSVNLPQIKVPPRPRGDSAKNQRLSTKLEKWTTAWLAEIEHQEGDRLTYRFLDHLCGDGHAIFKLVHRIDFWDGYPKLYCKSDCANNHTHVDKDNITDEVSEEYDEKITNFKTGAPLPFSLKVIDPLSYFPFKSDRGLEEVLEVTTRPKIYLAKRYNLRKDSAGKLVLKIGKSQPGGRNTPNTNLQGTSQYVEHWTADDVCYFVDGTLVDYKQHKYGRVPYFPALGTQTSSSEPDKEGLSVGHGLINLLPALDTLLTMKTNSAFLQAYPAFKRIRELGAANSALTGEDEDGQTESMEFEPGHFYEGAPGEDIMPIEIPSVGQDVNQTIEILLGIISKVGVPSAMEGNFSPNRVSGYAFSEMLNVSKTKYTTIIRNASFAFEEMIKFLWWLVENRIGEEISIWGETEKDEEGWLDITPKDVGNYFNVKVVLEPLLPEDDIAQGQHAAAMVGQGLWSKKYARENKMGISSPEEMEDEILVERSLELPQVQLYVLMKALERLELDDLKEIFQLSAENVEQQISDLVASEGGGAGTPGNEGLPNFAEGAGGGGQANQQGTLNGGQPGATPQPPVGIGQGDADAPV